MTKRYIYDAELAPVSGSTFQPTGFPDIGAATFTRYEDGREIDALLVESVQSMANRLEATAWNRAENQPVDAVRGLAMGYGVKFGRSVSHLNLDARRQAVGCHESPEKSQLNPEGHSLARKALGERIVRLHLDIGNIELGRILRPRIRTDEAV